MTAPAAEIDQTEIEPAVQSRGAAPRKTLAIACGALAREIVALSRGPLAGLDVTCLPAELHNRPERIPAAIRRKIRENRARYDEIVVLYGDCGTGGALDLMLAEEGVTRVAGPHCYALYTGEDAFAVMMAEEPGSFFVTDFLARHFDRLVIRGLGLDRFPDLRNDYFRRYKRLVYLAQSEDPGLTARAEAAAARLGLDCGGSPVLERYQRWRRFDTMTMGVSTDVLNRLFSNRSDVLRLLRDIGLGMVDRVPAMKRLRVMDADSVFPCGLSDAVILVPQVERRCSILDRIEPSPRAPVKPSWKNAISFE